MASILIIEDDDDLRLAIKRMLQMFGYDVIEAPDGEKGIQLYQEIPTDLIITDIFMPDKDGAAVVFELQENFPDIKMIVMSGGGQGDAKDYLNSIVKHSHVKRAFEKPFSLDEMLQAVKEAVG